MDIVLQVQDKEPVSVSQLAPETSRDLETIGLTCLNKATAKRYATAEKLSHDLNRWVNNETIYLGPAL